MRNLHSDFNAYADPMRFMLPQTQNVNGNTYKNVPDDNGNETNSKYGNASTPDSSVSCESSASSPSSSQSTSSLSTSSQETSKQNKKRKSGNMSSVMHACFFLFVCVFGMLLFSNV